MDREEKIKALDAAISQIEKQYGKGAVMKLGDSSANMNVEAIPTGAWIWHLGSVVFPREELLRYTDLNHQVRQP